MDIRCKNCGRVIADADLNPQTMIAVCSYCGHVFDFSDVVPEPAMTERIIQPPASLRVSERQGGVRVAYSWFTWRAPIFLTAGVFIMGVPVLLLDVMGGANTTVSGLLLVVLGLIALFGIGLSYYSLAQFVNSTALVITGEAVRVQHGPIPVPGNVQIDSDTVTQVNIRETRRETEYGLVVVYDVVVTLKDGSEHVLLRGLRRRDYAQYIDHQMRRYLKLSSRANRATLETAPNT